MAESRVADALRSFLRAHRGDLLAVAGLCVLAVAFLAPSVVDGGTFGPFDYDTTLTALGAGLYPHIHNPSNGDAVSQMISWNTLNWRMIHAGHFPLWNDYSGLGMPEFLNFESSVLSLPDLASYLVPLRDAFLVVVLVKFALAGTGAYLFSRVIRLRIPAALFAAVTFMFSGAFANWVTWPLSDVVAWTGWIAAFVVLVYRSPRRRWIVGLAVSVMFSVFGGFPEANVMMVLVIGVLFAVAGVVAWAYGRRPSISGFARLAVGTVAGVLLASPLWFPGLQVISGSHRTTEGNYAGLPIKSLPLLFAPGYLGQPFAGPKHYGLKNWNYYESAVYVGVPVLALAIIALLGARRRPMVIGLGCAVLIAFCASYQPIGLAPFFRVINHIGGLDSIRFERTKAVGSFALAVLGAVGFNDCWTLVADRRGLRRQWIGFGVLGLVVVAVTVRSFGTFVLDPRYLPHKRALIAPLLLVALLLLVGIVVAMARRQSMAVAPKIRIAGMVAILVGQGAFVFYSGVGLPTYGHAFYPATPAESRLASIVGDALVGLDGGNATALRAFGHVGYYPEVNIGYGIREFAIHDPLVPSAYFTSWPEPVTDAGAGGVGLFTPDINSAAIARRYGIGFILVGPTWPKPPGTTKVAVLADETLYRVPGAARFSFASPTGKVTGVTGSTTSGFSIATTAQSPSTLVLRVTALPGWHAAIDGKAAKLMRFDGVMESVTVPAGSHTVTLHYFPGRLKLGLLTALLTALTAAAYGLFGIVRRRRADGGARHVALDLPRVRN